MTSNNEDHPLFDPVSIGSIDCPNRVVMAPMTRNRADEQYAPTALNAEYYRQRASAGLIVTEATQVDPQGQGYPLTPGIYSEEQVQGWTKVTDAVHDDGGRIFLQLWHVGRISHSSYHDGDRPVAPSAIKPAGEVMTPDMEMVPFETPRALDTDEIPGIVDQYGRGARLANDAGFDGVEIHAANGYLIDQFLRSGTNQRTDRYGGSLENRTRFLEEVIESVTDEWAPDRVGIRYSPLSDFNDMSDDTPAETFGRAAAIAANHDLAYVHLAEPDEPKPPIRGDGTIRTVFSTIREQFDGPIMANGNYDLDSARDALDSGYADLISFARSFLANPDLPERLRSGGPINVPDESTFYGGGEEGYTDYPTLAELEDGAEVPTLSSLSELAARDG